MCLLCAHDIRKWWWNRHDLSVQYQVQLCCLLTFIWHTLFSLLWVKDGIFQSESSYLRSEILTPDIWRMQGTVWPVDGNNECWTHGQSKVELSHNSERRKYTEKKCGCRVKMRKGRSVRKWSTVEGEEKRGRECSKETLEKTNNNYQSPWLRQFSYGRAVKFSPPTIIMIEDKEREGERRRERE